MRYVDWILRAAVSGVNGTKSFFFGLRGFNMIALLFPPSPPYLLKSRLVGRGEPVMRSASRIDGRGAGVLPTEEIKEKKRLVMILLLHSLARYLRELPLSLIFLPKKPEPLGVSDLTVSILVGVTIGPPMKSAKSTIC